MTTSEIASAWGLSLDEVARLKIEMTERLEQLIRDDSEGSAS